MSRLVLVALILGLCSAPTTWAGGPVANFSDVTVSAGVVQDHTFIFNTTGQAWGDVDRDGCPDLYLTDYAGPNTLFRNRCDGTFEPHPLGGPLALSAERSSGAVFADYDNDGWLDLWVGGFGHSNHLFRNLAGAGWSDVTATAGVGHAGPASSGAWGDIDADGHLDLFVANYGVDFRPEARDILYRNRGDGTFEDVSHWIEEMRARGPAFANRFVDFDDDGDADLYVVNDKHFGNPLWRNDGPGCGGWCFVDVSETSGADRPVCGMGIAVGDYDRDGDLDFHFSGANELVLMENRTTPGAELFVEVGQQTGVDQDVIGWGAVFLDADNDGWLDIYQAISDTNPAISNRLFRNLGTSQGGIMAFEDVSDETGYGRSSGVASADYDRDGRMDVVVGNFGEGYALYRNIRDDASSRSWLLLTLEGHGRVNRDAIGTRVELVTTNGDRLVRDLASGASLGAGNELVLHFGLGSSAVDHLEIRWPDGQRQTLGAVPTGTTTHLVHPGLFYDGFESGTTTAWSATTP